MQDVRPFAPSVLTSIGGISIAKVKEHGGITAYDMNTGDKKWWRPNGNLWQQQTSDDPMFAGVTLPKQPMLPGQAQIITTKTLVIQGVGRNARARVAALQGGPGPQLYAFDKATGAPVGAVRVPSVTTAVPMTYMHEGRQYIVFATGQGANTSLVALALPR